MRSNWLSLGGDCDHNRWMRRVRGLQWALVIVAAAIGVLPASGDESDIVRPLLQVKFDRLIPTSYPTIKPSFTQLRPTTQPVIHPGVARIPITENLINAFAQPLLKVNAGTAAFPVEKVRRAESPADGYARSGSPGRVLTVTIRRSERPEKKLN